ncbi:hypothetical protein, partial [Staphylococcus aureus]|uniref:hypothetical protein n=1 Tax=Staphylococcus aureus TaxID=1280 RepID=UPI00301D5EFD
ILQKKNLKQFFPDLFLTWGHFWEENIRIPTKTVSVGFPYRSSQLGNMRGRGAKELLVLGDGANTEKYISLCEEIIEKGMVDYQIVFRPHPME